MADLVVLMILQNVKHFCRFEPSMMGFAIKIVHIIACDSKKMKILNLHLYSHKFNQKN